ncbi:MAG TPA: methyl-accepting chemotaxis protein [Thermoanaerobaculia bacterium]
MSFARRYIAWLLLPPALLTVPLAFLFLTRVVQLSPAELGGLFALLAVAWLGAAVVYWRGIRGPANRVGDQPGTDGAALSDAMSATLQRSGSISAGYWVFAAALVAVAGAYFFLPTTTGFAYFAVGALIMAFPAVVWAYAGGKWQLVSFLASQPATVSYAGRELSLTRKIAILFIGTFILASIALVLLVSSRVSTELERLALANSADRFQRAFDSANVLARVDADALDNMEAYIPDDHSLTLIPPSGEAISTGDALRADEIAAIRRLRNGNSAAYVGPHVSHFGQLRNGSILAMNVPWSQYQNIPREITFYTLVIALLTTLIFVAATILLTREIAMPLRELRTMAREMAAGEFTTVRQVFSDDEVGELARSFGETRANLRALLGRIGGSGVTITDGVRVITGGTESLLGRSRNQAELTEKSTAAVENVRNGIRSVLGAADSVSTQTEDASARALELQASAEEVAKSMDYLFQSVEKTSSSTTEMHASMAEMSKRTDVLAGIGDEVLSFVSELESMVGELRSTSESTADISRQVREDAEAGGKAVERTVQRIETDRELTESTAEVIENLAGSVGSISQMLNVIEEITNRTNLLALNAAIIAAQAGEHGLGFSVVADEIRELAERTRGSTKEISDVVKAVQTNSRQAVAKIRQGVLSVRENVATAQEAATSLEKIVESAARSYEMATKITRGLEEQTRASTHLHEVTSRMSDHISEINRATREQARGTELLAQESERIRDIAGGVKNATADQSLAGRGITEALESIAEQSRSMRDLLQRQLQETDRIADASRVMLTIAQQNDEIAREFSETVQSLVRSGQSFETEVSRFRIARS